MSKSAPTANSTSVNWSGYAVETNLASPQAYAFTDVQATWIVPSVSPSASSNHNAYSSTWIGLDGDSKSSKTVEQIGIEQDYINGKAVYYAWYEMYPKSPVKLDLVIQPGDTIFAEVKYLGNDTYQLTLEDRTSGQSFPTQIESSQPIRSSAEWIEEGTGRVANFNTVTFTNASATATEPTGTITGSISDPAWQTEEITLVNKSGGVIATPTPLSSHGSSFSINYEANSNTVATLTVSDGAHAANMALLGGDAGQHFSQLVGVADVHHDWHLDDRQAHAANMALLGGDAGQHFSQLVGVADVHHDWHLDDRQAHAANMASLGGDAGQHFSQLVGVADVQHDGLL